VPKEYYKRDPVTGQYSWTTDGGDLSQVSQVREEGGNTWATGNSPLGPMPEIPAGLPSTNVAPTSSTAPTTSKKTGAKAGTSATKPAVAKPSTAIPAAIGGAGGAGGGTAPPAAFAGLEAAKPGGGDLGGFGGEGATGAAMLNAPMSLRQGIGTRILPEMSMALAGLQRIY